MKNLLTIGAIAFIFAIGTQSLQAQSLSTDRNRPEEIAKVKLADLDKSLNLTDEQERSLFRALVQNEVNHSRYASDKVSPEKKKSNSIKFNAQLDDSAKKILSDEQYKRWLLLKDN